MTAISSSPAAAVAQPSATATALAAGTEGATTQTANGAASFGALVAGPAALAPAQGAPATATLPDPALGGETLSALLGQGAEEKAPFGVAPTQTPVQPTGKAGGKNVAKTATLPVATPEAPVTSGTTANPADSSASQKTAGDAAPVPDGWTTKTIEPESTDTNAPAPQASMVPPAPIPQSQVAQAAAVPLAKAPSAAPLPTTEQPQGDTATATTAPAATATRGRAKTAITQASAATDNNASAAPPSNALAANARDSFASALTGQDGAATAAPIDKAAPTAAAHPIVSGHPNRIGQEMGIEIARHVGAGAEQVTVRLDPAELGRIEVRMGFDDSGQLRATLSASQPATLDLLRQDSGNLNRALQDAGISTDAQSFHFDSRADQQTNQQQAAPRWHRQNSGDASPQDTAEHAPVPDTTRYRPLNDGGRINMVA